MKNLNTSATLKAVLDEAQKFERLRDFDSIADILEQVWSDFSKEPSTNGLSKKNKAEFLRLCGNFLVCYGRAKNRRDYLEPSKDLLTKALFLFRKIGDIQGQTRTACNIAMSYCYDDRADTAYIITTGAEHLFPADSGDPAYLQLKVTQMVSLNLELKYKKCVEIIDAIGERIETLGDDYLATLFFYQCGSVFANLKNYELSVKMYSKAIDGFKKTNDERSLYQASNNLANALRRCGYPKLAFEHICRAIALVKKFRDFGYLPNFEDTKANILLALNNTDSALEIINQSIFRLSLSGDARTMCEALWTKVEILISKTHFKEAELAYTQLQRLAQSELSAELSENYDNLFENLTSKIKARILPIKISRFCPKDQRLINLPENKFRLFFVPSQFASILGFNCDVIICAVREKQNPMLMKRGDTGEFFLGYLKADDSFELNFGAFSLETSENGEEIFFPDSDFIEGHVCSVAKYSDKNLIFENI